MLSTSGEGFMKTVAGLIAAFCLAAFGAQGVSASPAGPVKVSGGMVQGEMEGDIAVFRGVPFAAPPVGDLRWKAPAPVKTWSGVKQTTTFAPACMQNTAPRFGRPGLTVSEDCLYLNVWTPALSAGKKLPVMVWIYGGGFSAGATSYADFDGANLAKKGVVVVSVAYRVGSFGFLAHPALSAESPYHASGDYGFLDQIAGLKWVKDNIAALGGDPDRVTIFGESAGGISVSILAGSPLTKGLIQRAISESGGSFGPNLEYGIPGVRVEPLEVAEKRGEAYAGKFGARTAADLRALPADVIEKADSESPGIHPVVLDHHVIMGDQYKLYEQGRYNDVPVLIGTNSDEGALFVRSMTATDFKKSVESGYGPYAQNILKIYPATDDAVALQSARDLTRDTNYAWSTWSWARLQAKTGKSKVFLYYFAHKPPEAPNAGFTSKGASHGAEIAYVFDHGKRWTDRDRALSEQVMTYWTNFAKTGDPNGDGVPHWPAYRGSDPMVMHFNDTAEAGPLPNAEQLKAVDQYMAWRRGQEKAAP
jgi:para-nitrobenzyl esterase